MGLPNDSILVTPGTGATVATELISAKEYQVIMVADGFGHIIGGRDVYVASALAMAKAASKNYLTVFNATGSAKTVEIVYASVITSLTAAVTGLARGYRLFRITAHSVGTLITPVKLKSSSPALPAEITARKDGVTMTVSGDPLGIGVTNEEETGSAGMEANLFDECKIGEPIICAVGEGIGIQQDATAGVGVLNAFIYFRVR